MSETYVQVPRRLLQELARCLAPRASQEQEIPDPFVAEIVAALEDAGATNARGPRSPRQLEEFKECLGATPLRAFAEAVREAELEFGKPIGFPVGWWIVKVRRGPRKSVETNAASVPAAEAELPPALSMEEVLAALREVAVV